MTNISFESINITEEREAMVWLGNYPFINVPVYFHNGWSKTPDMFLRQRLANKLLDIQQAVLTPKGLRWIIYDGYRDRSVQANIYQYYWKKFSKEKPSITQEQMKELVGVYVTVPESLSRIPPHATGGSVDLGLYDIKNSCIVGLGTDFDEFTPVARNAYFEQDREDVTIRDWRRFLSAVLIEKGVTSDPDEFFHKDYGNQKWAVHTHQPQAYYGEIVECRRENGRVVSVFGIDETVEETQLRIDAIVRGLNLAHPVNSVIAPLPDPTELVRRVVGDGRFCLALE